MNNILKVVLIAILYFGALTLFSVKAGEYQREKEIKILEVKKEKIIKKIDIEINKYLALQKKIGLEKSEINILNKLECFIIKVNNCKTLKELEKTINEL